MTLLGHPILLTCAVVTTVSSVFLVFVDFINRAYNTHDLLLVVAPYARPWLFAFWILLCACFHFLAWWCSVRLKQRWTRLVVGVALSFATIACALELGSTVSYHLVSGRLSVTYAIGSRSNIEIDVNQDGPCVVARMPSPFLWEINGHPFLLSLLPLPRESSELQAVLRRAYHRDDCPQLKPSTSER